MKIKFKKKSIILLLIIISPVLMYLRINKMKVVKIESTDDELAVCSEIKQISKENNVKNILLLGVDEEENASDTIMILSIDKDDKTLKLVFIMRDSYINFGANKVNKINYAYHYGGVENSIKTINENYSLDIRDFVKVSFEQLEGIVDAVGGIEVDLQPKELDAVNNGAKALAFANEERYDKYISKPGRYNLDGKQVISYCRIRHLDSDFNRTQRQRNVMQGIFQKIKKISPVDYPSIVSKLSSSIETNLDALDIISLGNEVYGFNNNNISELRLPVDGTTQDDMSTGIYYLKWNKETNIKALHKFLYNR